MLVILTHVKSTQCDASACDMDMSTTHNHRRALAGCHVMV